MAGNLRYIAFLAFVAASASVSTPSMALTAQSKSCLERSQGLTAADRATFLTKCKKGALAPEHPTAPIVGGPNATAITAPSGVDRTVRSRQCSAAADRRGLKDNARAQFRMSCLATAGPVSEAETAAKTPVPAHAKAALGEVKAAPH